MKAYNLISVSICFIFIFSACNSRGKYQISEHSELDEIYNLAFEGKVGTSQRMNLPLSTKDFDNTLKAYLSKQNKSNLVTPIIELKDIGLYEDWGIYGHDNEYDTIFYTRIKPHLVKIGLQDKEHWVIESVDCEWQKSSQLTGIDILPLAQLEYSYTPEAGIISRIGLQLVIKSNGQHYSIYGLGSFGSKGGEKLNGWDFKVHDPEILGNDVAKQIKNIGVIRENGALF